MRRKKQKTKKIILTILFLAALGAIGFVVYKNFFEKKEETKPAQTTQTQTLKPEPEPTPETKPIDDEKVNGKDPIYQYDGKNPNESESLTGVITYAGATSTNLIIRVNIDQYISGGTCNLSLSQGGSVVYTASANLIADVSTSTCEGFTVPLSNLNPGYYSIKIDLTSSDKTGVIEGEVNL